MSVELNRDGRFIQVYERTGTFTDDADLNDPNTVLLSAERMHPLGGGHVALYWNAEPIPEVPDPFEAEVPVGGDLTLQLWVWGGESNLWLLAGSTASLAPLTITALPTHSASLCCVRFDATSGATGMNLVAYACSVLD